MTYRKVFSAILVILSMIACFLMGFICGLQTNPNPNVQNQNEEIGASKENGNDNPKETEEITGSSGTPTEPTTMPQGSTTDPLKSTPDIISPTTEVEQLPSAVTEPSETHVPDVPVSTTVPPDYAYDMGEF